MHVYCMLACKTVLVWWSCGKANACFKKIYACMHLHLHLHLYAHARKDMHSDICANKRACAHTYCTSLIMYAHASPSLSKGVIQNVSFNKNIHIHSAESYSLQVQSDTLHETNMAPESKPFQNESILPTINFLVLC